MYCAFCKEVIRESPIVTENNNAFCPNHVKPALDAFVFIKSVANQQVNDYLNRQLSQLKVKGADWLKKKLDGIFDNFKK